VEAICDRVIIINKGNLVANDSLTNLRKGSSTNLVKVGFKEEIAESLLQELPAAKSIHRTDPNNWQLATDDSELLRKQILELALRHNLNIVSLQSENQSLEEVFRNLTNNPVNN
jgi:ABC-2 type transport system ATP-binding protein